MVNYGQDKEFQIKVESVDYFPEIAGIKISNFPAIAVGTMVPLLLNQMELACGMLILLVAFFYRAGRREDEGRPIFLNASLIWLSKVIPGPVRTMFLPSFAHIKIHKQEFRR